MNALPIPPTATYPAPTPTTRSSRAGATLVGLTLLVSGVLVVGAVPRLGRASALERAQRQREVALARVQLGAVRLAPATRPLALPASLQPVAQAELFAQATGYVRERLVDIGDRVEAGQLLAVLDVPLVDEDLNKARAAQVEAEAAVVEAEKQLALARVTLGRWEDLVRRGINSRQELDERRATADVAAAAVDAAKAAVGTRVADVLRLEHARAFSRVVAPFAGTITARTVEVGDFVTTGGPGTTPMFTLADTLTLRVLVDVPQSLAAGVAAGQTASIALKERPGAPLGGTVTRTAGALDPRTRTLRVEVTVPNADGRVLAGAYGEVRLELHEAARPVLIPGAALLVRAEGPRVAIVDAADTLRYVAVSVGRDLGTEVEVTRGLTGDERVVVNMADELAEGSHVAAVPVK